MKPKGETKRTSPLRIPLDFDESLRLVMQVKPEPKAKAKPRAKKRAPKK
jgi:hypothetical protein